MRRATSNAADVNRPGKLWLLRVSDIVLAHLAGPPTGDVEEPIIQGEVDVSDKGRHCAKPLQQRRQLVFGRRLGRDRRRLLDVEFAALAPPGPDRSFEVCGVDHDAEETVFSDRIVRRADLEQHLVVGAEVDRLHVAPSPEIPEVDPMAVLSAALR